MRTPPSKLWELATSRRGFFQLAGTTASLAALARVSAVSGAAQAVGNGAERFFSDSDREILTQLVERMVHTGDPRAPAVRDTQTIDVIDGLCAGLDPSLTQPLPLALKLFEYGPFLFELRFARFTSLNDLEQDAVLEGWMRSRFGIRRLAFTAIRNMALLGYYSQESTWPLIGYQGPLIPRTGVAS